MAALAPVRCTRRVYPPRGATRRHSCVSRQVAPQLGSREPRVHCLRSSATARATKRVERRVALVARVVDAGRRPRFARVAQARRRPPRRRCASGGVVYRAQDSRGAVRTWFALSLPVSAASVAGAEQRNCPAWRIRPISSPWTRRRCSFSSSRPAIRTRRSTLSSARAETLGATASGAVERVPALPDETGATARQGRGARFSAIAEVEWMDRSPARGAPPARAAGQRLDPPRQAGPTDTAPEQGRTIGFVLASMLPRVSAPPALAPPAAPAPGPCGAGRSPP